MKNVLFAAAAFVAIAPFAATASAEIQTPITVSIEFDHDLLVSDAGAEVVLSDMRHQARSACTTPGSKFGRGPVVDRACADDVLAKAAVQILAEREEMGLKTAPAFARLATVETASY
ncbi:MAG: UrcA family protein [Hyphomonas sp.]|nr:UrcA family protein [Hyphomonas sp.]HRX72479.1 UrcA family protein [Hyphomonas sp.]